MPRPADLRVRKVERLLRDALGEILSREAEEPGGALVTVTRVTATPDLLTARVSLSVFGAPDPEAALERLRRRTGWFRHQLAARVELKYNPALLFELDPGPEFADRLEKLIEKARRHDSEPD
ncbi:MAG: ribosome-binding factor A [Acidobacteriota bacterium]|nr:ribosome-binding factor A [Acidobacteriota bacterium]